MKYKVVFVFVVFTMLSAALAQAQKESINSNSRVRPATATCAYTFTNPGPGNSYLQFCVTANGNIAEFMSPSGYDQLAQGGVGEGYGICDTSTGVAYYDWAYTDSGNWNPSVVLASSSTSVKIARTTSDGLFTLTQTIAKQAGTVPYAKITMALKNNVPSAKTVYLERYADVDPLNAPFADTDFTESFDSTFNSAWGYTALNYSGPNFAGWGMMLSQIGVPKGASGYFYEGIDQAFSGGPAPCSPTASYGAYQASVDGSVEFFWDLGIGGTKTATVNAKYELF